MFDGIHDLSQRDTHRDWSLSNVKTKHFDVSKQPVTAYQNPWELAQFVELYVRKFPSTVLELGPCKGGVLWHWIHNAPHNDETKIAAVDWFDGMMGGEVEATPKEWREWASTNPNITFDFFQGNTRDLEIVKKVREFFSGRIEWLFIDATHDYDSVRADFENYGNMVPSGGVIAFHDIRPIGNGSWQVFTECQRAGYKTQELVADPNATEAGIGIVYV